MFGKSPLKISGMKDVHLSDWKRFGTGSLEGRAEIKLSESNTENDLGTAFTFAGSSALSEKIDVLVTLPVVFNAEAIAVGLNLGINYKLFDKRFLTFGVAPEIGFHYAMLSATTIEMLPGKTGPIITDNYTFAAGDQITGTAKGVAGSLSAIASLNLTKSFAIEAKAGVQLGIFSEPVLEFGEGSDKKELDFDDPAVVEAVDGSTNPVKYEGKISTTGFLFGVGIKYAR